MRERLYVQNFAFDPSMAPPGKSVLKILLATRFKYWEDLHLQPARYQTAKRQICDTVIGLLARRFPGVPLQVEIADGATPMTTLRYTGNGHGYRASMARMALARDVARAICRRDGKDFTASLPAPSVQPVGVQSRVA
jgi:phytoene dehydrogenase-like protein